MEKDQDKIAQMEPDASLSVDAILQDIFDNKEDVQRVSVKGSKDSRSKSSSSSSELEIIKMDDDSKNTDEDNSNPSSEDGSTEVKRKSRKITNKRIEVERHSPVQGPMTPNLDTEGDEPINETPIRSPNQEPQELLSPGQEIQEEDDENDDIPLEKK